MFVIGEAILEDQIAREFFSCDLAACRGACCTLPGCRGAPLADHETDILQLLYPVVRKYLPERHRQVAEDVGLFEGEPGDFATTSVAQRECVFVYYEGDIAKCSLEKAFLVGETTWRKPVSCHLFPIRVSGTGSARLRYEQISECRPARVEGRKKEVTVGEFLLGPLARIYGDEWCRRLRDEITKITQSSEG
jgi:hypothetical protein